MVEKTSNCSSRCMCDYLGLLREVWFRSNPDVSQVWYSSPCEDAVLQLGRDFKGRMVCRQSHKFSFGPASSVQSDLCCGMLQPSHLCQLPANTAPCPLTLSLELFCSREVFVS